MGLPLLVLACTLPWPARAQMNGMQGGFPSGFGGNSGFGGGMPSGFGGNSGGGMPSGFGGRPNFGGQPASAGDSCRYANDGECDEPAFCDAGTDTSDCGGGDASCEDLSHGMQNSCDDYEANGWCETYGADQSFADNNGVTASQACCACGGGQTAPSCEDLSHGMQNSCEDYEANGWCETYGADPSFADNNGVTASRACCACGGGSTGPGGAEVLPPTPALTPAAPTPTPPAPTPTPPAPTPTPPAPTPTPTPPAPTPTPPAPTPTPTAPAWAPTPTPPASTPPETSSPEQEVVSSTTLAGLPFYQLTRTTKRTIEAAIQARLGALRVSATYHAHERARSRRLNHGGEAHTGDTVVEWDAVFASAADATAAKEASVASFDDELAEELAADPSFDGVTVITSTFVSPGETPAAPPADGSESGSAVVAANEEGGDGAAAEVDGTVSSQSVGSLVVMVGICCAPPLLFLALMAKRVSEKLGHVSDEPMHGEFDPEDGGDAGGDGTLDAPKPFTGRYDSGEEDSSLSSDEGSSGEEAKFEGGDGDVELTVIRGASGDDEGDEEDGSNDDTTTV